MPPVQNEVIKNEAPKLETSEEKAAKETKEFNDNLAKVSEAIKAPEKSDAIAEVLDSSFKKGLENLYATDDGKATIQNIAKQIKAMNLTDAHTTIDTTDKAALQALLTIITPLTMETTTTTTKFDKTFTGDIKDTGTDVKYNKLSKELTQAQTNIMDEKYKDLPGLDLISKALNTPTKENITALQTFLDANLADGEVKTNLEAKSKKNDERDGKYGPKTDAALQAYLKEFTDFKPTTTTNADQINQAKNAADKITKATDEVKIKIEETTDKNADLAIINSKITYTHPEWADKELKNDLPDNKMSYRGTIANKADFLIAPKVPTGSGIGLSAPDMLNLIQVDEAKIDERKANIDRTIDAQIMTYDATTNHYVYQGKYISREDVGTGPNQMTLETFQTEVDKMLLNKDNDSRMPNITKTSTDGKTTTIIKDFEGGRGGKIITETKNDDGSSKKVIEVQRGTTTKVATRETDEDGLTSKTKIKENKNRIKEKYSNPDSYVMDGMTPDNNLPDRDHPEKVVAALQAGLPNYIIRPYGNDLQYININTRNKSQLLSKEDFLKAFSKALSDQGIAKLDWSKTKMLIKKDDAKKLVTDLDFKIDGFYMGTKKTETKPQTPDKPLNTPVITTIDKDKDSDNLTLTADDFAHYDKNPKYDEIITKLGKSRNGLSINLGDELHTGKITALEPGLTITTDEGSTSLEIKALSKDTIIVYTGEPGNRKEITIYNHGSYADNNATKTENIYDYASSDTPDKNIPSKEGTTTIDKTIHGKVVQLKTTTDKQGQIISKSFEGKSLDLKSPDGTTNTTIDFSVSGEYRNGDIISSKAVFKLPSDIGRATLKESTKNSPGVVISEDNHSITVVSLPNESSVDVVGILNGDEMSIGTIINGFNGTLLTANKIT